MPPVDVVDAPENAQRQVLMLVLWAGEDWFTIRELAENVGDLITALDAMSALCDAGLIHRQDDYVFPTRAAIHLHELFGACW
jgi:predicted transcriptional regulator